MAESSLLHDLVACVDNPGFKPIGLAYVVQFVNFLAFFPIFMFGTTYFGVTLNGGVASSKEGEAGFDAFHEGQRDGNYALMAMSLLALLYSLLLQRLLWPEGVKPLIMLSSTVLGIELLLAAFFVDSVIVGYLVFIPIGIAWASTTVIPWYVVSCASAGLPDAGIYSGLFNSSQCLPEIVVAIISAVVLPLSGSNYRILLGLGGAASLTNLYFAQSLLVPDVDKEEIVSVLEKETEASSLLEPPQEEVGATTVAADAVR